MRLEKMTVKTLLFLCHITSLDLSMDNMQCPPWVLSIAQLFSEAEKGKKEERESVPVNVITMLAYGNIGKQPCSLVPSSPTTATTSHKLLHLDGVSSSD